MEQQREVQVGSVRVGGERALTFIGGPCVIESRDSALRHAAAIKAITDRLGIPFIYKSSFDKANRTALSSYRGPGLDDGLEILAEVRREVGTPVVTDVHEPQQVKAVAEVADLLQTPAFLCRQTDFLLAVAQAGKPVNIKKGQFLAPWDVGGAVGKDHFNGKPPGARHRARCQLWVQTTWWSIRGRWRCWRRSGIRWCTTLAIVFNFPAGRARPLAGSGGLFDRWRAQRQPSGWPQCSSKSMKILTGHSAMGRTHIH